MIQPPRTIHIMKSPIKTQNPQLLIKLVLLCAGFSVGIPRVGSEKGNSFSLSTGNEKNLKFDNKLRFWFFDGQRPTHDSDYIGWTFWSIDDIAVIQTFKLWSCIWILSLLFSNILNLVCFVIKSSKTENYRLKSTRLAPETFINKLLSWKFFSFKSNQKLQI